MRYSLIIGRMKFHSFTKKAKDMEDRIQAEIVKFLRGKDIFVFSIPNEGAGRNGAIRTAQLITMGLYPGAADLCVWWTKDNRTIVGYLEVKTATGRQSDRQKRFEEKCIGKGIPYHVVRSVGDVREYMAQEGFG